MAYAEAPEAGFWSKPVVAGALSVLFFGTAMTGWLVQLVRKKDAMLEIGPDGIFDRRIARKPVSWRSIRNISTRTIHRNLFIVLDVAENKEDILKSNRFSRWFSKLDKVVGIGGITVSASGLDVPAKDLVKIIEVYAKAHDSPAAKRLD